MVKEQKRTKNTLSLSEYARQKTDKAASEKIAIALCNATKRAWEDCHFSESKAQNIIPGSAIFCEGYNISFQLHTEERHNPEDANYGSIESITNNEKYTSIDIDEIEQYKIMHNQDWGIVCKYYFKNLGAYLDLNRVELFNTYYKPNSKIAKKITDFQPSLVYAPNAFKGSEPTIAISLVFATLKQLNDFNQKLQEHEKESAEK